MFDLVVFVAAALKCEDREPGDLAETAVSRSRPQLLPPGKSHFTLQSSHSVTLKHHTSWCLK